jgi:hypothetical protein
MDSSILAIIGVIVGAIVFYRLLSGNTSNRELASALKTGETQPLIDSILALRPQLQGDAFHKAIGRLWNGYQREAAVPVIKALATTHTETRIAQYWLDQLQKVEPELAEETLDGDFLKENYRPQIAAKCGQFG